jgi:surfeit locus 1 family protein
MRRIAAEPGADERARSLGPSRKPSDRLYLPWSEIPDRTTQSLDVNDIDMRRSGGTGKLTGFRPRLWPSLFAAAGVALLVGLGVWQVQRLHWKEGLIAARQASLGAAPVPVPADAAAARRLEFHPVVAAGRFLNDREILVHSISQDGEGGFDVWTPLLMADGRSVFVDRGFVPMALAARGRRPAGEPDGPVTVRGLLRLPRAQKPGWFLPDNDPARGQWFWPDPKAMAAADRLAAIAPYTIDADSTPNPGGWPKGGVTPLDLPNHHLQYALTWFSLAVALAVIYVLSQRGTADRK